MKTENFLTFLVAGSFLPLWSAVAQVNSGSDGSDGAFTPTINTVFDMRYRPDGIYQFTSVDIPASVTITFIPNTNNTPVVWLVQSNCTIAGWIDVSGQIGVNQVGGQGGPGGFAGGNGGALAGSAGQGPGGGMLGGYAFSASYGRQYTTCSGNTNGLGAIYGNSYLLPLIGGSGGGGTTNGAWGGGGGGGGGAILIAASQTITLNGSIRSLGGPAASWTLPGSFSISSGGGSGGAVRLVATTVTGSGVIDTSGGYAGAGTICERAGMGRARVDALNILYAGSPPTAVYSQGFQPIIIPPLTQAVSLSIQSVGGVSVAAYPSGSLASPDVVIPGQQTNPIPIVVQCANIPLNTPITVEVKPVGSQVIAATAGNGAGTQASSTATVSVNLPRGGGTIQAKAVSGITSLFSSAKGSSSRIKSLATTGWTADGERFAAVEVAAMLGRPSQTFYLTSSGKRYSLTGK